MRVYHFVSARYGLEDIEKRRLKVATLDDLNDPFELLAFSLAEARTAEALVAVKNELARKHGLLCFSGNYSNPVQWSHYAEKHRGICLGFDIADEFLMQVQYSEHRLDARPLLSIGDEANSAFEKAAATKFEHWSYEEEWRIWINLEEKDPTSGLYFEDFRNDLALRDVIIGHASHVTYDHVSSALGDHEGTVCIYKAQLALDAFRVDRELISPQRL